MDALLKLEQGHKQTQESEDMTGAKTYKDVLVPYTDEQKQAILQRLFPNRFADVGASNPNPNPAPQPGAQGGSASAQTPPPAQPAQTPAPVARTVEDAKKKWGVRN